ncbi:universal stress protein [Candidatus Uabimicrobium amorphum]|uniref:Universal stress protein n=1 Tax=Uabimicrobium amorphum TaxID=2596890 RepID=A0A5S9F4E9_UABAM|nr:universal stress protein [Candidatus Uabimicrobium amorphum]BBM84519.1 universal stress protein [Candidatus Uabimicrobium amorphum]
MDLSFKQIFHPSDLSPASNIALAHAVKFSLLTNAKLDILHVAESVTSDDFPKVRKLLEKWQLLPENSTPQDLKKMGLFVKKVGIQGANSLSRISNYISTKELDMIVLSTNQKKGFTRWLDKSISEPIARESKTLTLFIPGECQGFVSYDTGKVKLHNIIIPIAKDPDPQYSINCATQLALTCKLDKVCFTLVHVGENCPSVNTEERQGWKWQTIVSKGNLVKEIIGKADENQGDLIIMTTKGHDGFLDMFRGSHTEQVLRNAKCPVLAVPNVPWIIED